MIQFSSFQTRSSSPLLGFFGRLGGMISTVLAVLVGLGLAALTLMFAATAAVIGAVGAGLLFLTSVLFGNRSRPQPVRAENGVIEARKVGHAWVAYGWDQNGR